MNVVNCSLAATLKKGTDATRGGGGVGRELRTVRVEFVGKN
jgi:hypothetical protein